MKIIMNLKTLFLLSIFLFSLISCSANQAMKNQQSKALRNLGEAYIQQGNFTAALRELLKAKELNSNDPNLHNDLGMVYMNKGYIDSAIEHFKKALELENHYAPAKNNLGISYLISKNWDAAILIFQELQRDLLYVNPHKPLANMGWAYYNKKEYEIAEKYYKEALNIEPEFIIAMKGLGMTWMSMGKIPEAIKIFEKAISKSPKFAELYFEAAQAYTLAFEYDKAIKAYEKVVELTRNEELIYKSQLSINKLKSIQAHIQNSAH